MGVILFTCALVLSMVLKNQDHGLLGSLPDIPVLLDPLLHPVDDLLDDVLGDPLPSPASHGRVAAAVRISQPVVSAPMGDGVEEGVRNFLLTSSAHPLPPPSG